jgi:hypothetical protein
MSLRNSIHHLNICLEIGSVFVKFDQKNSNFSSHNDNAAAVDEELSSVLIILSLLLALSRPAAVLRYLLILC